MLTDYHTPGNTEEPEHLELIIFNAKFDKVQAIQYQGDTVFVISEAQYKKLLIS